MKTTDYNKMYEEKLKALKEKTLGSAINEALTMKSIKNERLDEIRKRMSTIVPGKDQIWDDFNFKTGKIFGILRFIAQNGKYRNELLKASGLTQDHIDIYFNVCGNLPYENKVDNTINIGKPMDIEATREFIMIVAAHLGVLIDENDLYDITQERWDRLYNNALEKITETINHNKQHGDSIPKEGYEE